MRVLIGPTPTLHMATGTRATTFAHVTVARIMSSVEYRLRPVEAGAENLHDAPAREHQPVA